MGEVSLLNVNTYTSYFGFKGGKVDLRSNYIWTAADDEIDKFGALNIDPATAQDGDTRVLTDTLLEFALLSYYSRPVINIRPVQAAELLPANNPKLAGLKLGAALYQEIQVLRFLGDTAAVGRYEGMLRFISERNGVTRAEIENFYRNGIRGLVAGAVNEEFNKISFVLDTDKGSYHTILARNPQTGQYVLSYERPSVANDDKKLSAQTLEALLATMSKSPDFSQSGIQQVRDQAALLPAVVYARWKQLGIAQGVDGTALVIDTLTDFYLNPSRQTFEAVRGVYARYNYLCSLGDPFASIGFDNYLDLLSALTPELRRRVTSEVNDNNMTDMAKIPSDPKYNVFAMRYGEGL